MGAGRTRLTLCGMLAVGGCFAAANARAAPALRLELSGSYAAGASSTENAELGGSDASGASSAESSELGARDSLPPHELGESWWVPSGHGLAVMTGMRIGSAILWPDPFGRLDVDAAADSYAEAFTRPPRWDSDARAFEWDGDRWYINVIGHGLFGSELYVRARLCQKQVLPALLFTVAGSAAWEYVFEANAVRPSGLDLWYTPLAGSLLGEVRYIVWSAANRMSNPTWRGIVSVLVDPLGEFERAVLSTRC